ncbi:hypothetical protein [Nonlabens marinus]|uniref:Uncharacterized protein n=1 Tax=Nonlabens marinus S1-08 TaxID=1454201 RepID=W8VXE3_9FLAO|nr:hypothetical protein [Nonlabens marinus]BAO55777.1 hypothetical protein NMS_1768 [Nonlabens marinus S1-08]
MKSSYRDDDRSFLDFGRLEAGGWRLEAGGWRLLKKTNSKELAIGNQRFPKEINNWQFTFWDLRFEILRFRNYHFRF